MFADRIISAPSLIQYACTGSFPCRNKKTSENRTLFYGWPNPSSVSLLMSVYAYSILVVQPHLNTKHAPFKTHRHDHADVLIIII